MLYKTNLSMVIPNLYKELLSPVGKVCKIHRMYLYRGVRPPTNECPGLDNKPSDGGALENVEHPPFIAIAPRSTLARGGST